MRNPERSILAALCVVIASTGLVACRSAAPAEPDRGRPVDIEVEPAPPAREPFVAPAWEAKEYRNEELGFSVHYPADFVEQPPPPGSLFAAASPAQAPRIDISTMPASDATSLDGLAAGVETMLAAVGGGEAKVTAKEETTLRDGVTPAIELTADWSFQGFPLQSTMLVARQGDNAVTVLVTGMQGADLAQLSDIAYTLYFDP